MNIKEMTSGDLIELLEEIKRELETRKEAVAAQYEQEQKENERLILSAKTAEIIKKIRGIIRNISQEKRTRPDIFINERKSGKTIKVQFPYNTEREALFILTEIKTAVEKLPGVEKSEIYESDRYGFGILQSLRIKV